MGYPKCAFPGCGSRYGQGIIFKLFPKNPVLAEKWKRQLPHLTRFSSARVCEKHFDSCMFEKLREDGRKKLKRDAVPSISTSVLMPMKRSLGDITNSATSQPVTFASDAASSHKHGQGSNMSLQIDSIDCPIPSFQVPSASQEVAIPILESDEICPQLALNLNPPTLLESGVADITSVVEQLTNENDELKAEVVAKDNIIRQLIEERNGLVEMLQQMKEEKEQTISSLKSEIAREKEKTTEALESFNRRILREKEGMVRVVKSLSKFVYTSQSAYYYIRNKYLSLKKVAARLQQKLGRKSFSPWLHSTQQKLLIRRSAQSLKWHRVVIREGLELKMKYASSGTREFVSADLWTL